MQKTLMEKIINYERKAVSELIPIYKENKVTVWKSTNEIKPGKAPVLMIPAMINRYYILDLSNDHSICKYLSDNGHPTYIIDWGEATAEDRWNTFTDIFLGTLKRIMTRVTRDAGAKPVLFGYCMGGTMSSIYASCFPDEIQALIALTAPIDFHKAGVMSQWTSKQYLNPNNLIDAIGNIPPEMTQNGFVSLKPMKWMRKWETVWKKQDNEKFVESFLTLENWVNDNIPFPGGVWQEYISWLYQDNLLYNDKLYIGKHKASLKNISCPVLTLIAEEDHIVPKEAAEPLHDMAGSTKKTVKYFNGGHVGIVTSPKLFPQLTQSVGEWLEDFCRTRG